MNAPQTRPRHNRSSVELKAELSRVVGASETVEVQDISIDGCCVRGYFRVGESVTLRLPKIGGFSARVCWARGGRAGLKFHRGSTS
jgi:hypothetical protein